jgi:hypothetical protein
MVNDSREYLIFLTRKKTYLSARYDEQGFRGEVCKIISKAFQNTDSVRNFLAHTKQDGFDELVHFLRSAYPSTSDIGFERHAVLELVAYAEGCGVIRRADSNRLQIALRSPWQRMNKWFIGQQDRSQPK